MGLIAEEEAGDDEFFRGKLPPRRPFHTLRHTNANKVKKGARSRGFKVTAPAFAGLIVGGGQVAASGFVTASPRFSVAGVWSIGS